LFIVQAYYKHGSIAVDLLREGAAQKLMNVVFTKHITAFSITTSEQCKTMNKEDFLVFLDQWMETHTEFCEMPYHQNCWERRVFSDGYLPELMYCGSTSDCVV